MNTTAQAHNHLRFGASASGGTARMEKGLSRVWRECGKGKRAAGTMSLHLVERWSFLLSLSYRCRYRYRYVRLSLLGLANLPSSAYVRHCEDGLFTPPITPIRSESISFQSRRNIELNNYVPNPIASAYNCTEHRKWPSWKWRNSQSSRQLP